MIEKIEGLCERRANLQKRYEEISDPNDVRCDILLHQIAEIDEELKKYPNVPQIKLETIAQPLNTNQYVIEIRREDGTAPDLYVEDFVCYQEAREILYQRKESQSAMALHEYLARDKNGFRRILYSSTFCEKFGFTRISFQRGFDALIFDGIIKPTHRMALGTNGVRCHILIFDKVLPKEGLPEETYNYKDNTHLEKVREIKRAYGLIS